jgi:hypothetical protein
VPGYREDPAYYALDYDPIDHEDDYWDDFAAGRLYAVVEDGRCVGFVAREGEHLDCSPSWLGAGSTPG